MKTANVRLKRYFWWINERHSIYLKKKAGDPWPWTKDPILQAYSFTNVFRELDAETVKFHERIDLLDLMPADKLYHMIMHRAFNRHQTYDMLTRGKTTCHSPAKMKRILHRSADRGKKIFTGAYIITNAGRSESKIDLMCDALGVHWRGRHKIYEEMRDDGTMRGCTDILRMYPMQGSFTAYEVICDMRHQKGMLDRAPDRRTWANPGPGARRGINRIVSGERKPNVFRTSEEYVEFMVELLKTSPKYLGDHVKKERLPFEMREVEHSLCEYSKLCEGMEGRRLKRLYRGGTP